LSDVLVVGVGNPSRGDDGAGIAVAQALKKKSLPGVDVREATGEALALIALWEGYEDVVLVDAAHSGAAPGTIHIFPTVADVPARHGTGTSTHGFGVAEALALAKELGRLPRRCAVVAIEGADYDLGAQLSPAVRAAVDSVVARVAERLGGMARSG